jgi:hypothetical protein
MHGDNSMMLRKVTGSGNVRRTRLSLRAGRRIRNLAGLAPVRRDQPGLAMETGIPDLLAAALRLARTHLTVATYLAEQMKKYSTANLGLRTGIFAFTCMLAALTSFRVGWPPFQLWDAGKYRATVKWRARLCRKSAND